MEIKSTTSVIACQNHMVRAWLEIAWLMAARRWWILAKRLCIDHSIMVTCSFSASADLTRQRKRVQPWALFRSFKLSVKKLLTCSCSIYIHLSCTVRDIPIFFFIFKHFVSGNSGQISAWVADFTSTHLRMCWNWCSNVEIVPGKLIQANFNVASCGLISWIVASSSANKEKKYFMAQTATAGLRLFQIKSGNSGVHVKRGGERKWFARICSWNWSNLCEKLVKRWCASLKFWIILAYRWFSWIQN